MVEHAPGPLPGAVKEPAFLVLPPLGYEDTCAYRPLRGLADGLAADGHLVLRVDWPGLGDSALDADVPGLLDQQLAVVAAAVAALRARGVKRIAALGVRAGALLALAVPGLDELVLWGTPESGRRFLREQRAFHKMAARACGEPPPGLAPLPEGAVEAGGFLYTPSTVTALEALDAAALARARRPARVLLLPRDGAEVDPALRQALAASGAEVSVQAGLGLGDLLEDPYHAKLHPDVAAAVRGWAAAGAGPGRVGPAVGQATLAVTPGVVERHLAFPGGAGELSGIVCAPAGGVPPGVAWTVFFNAGGVRRSGPNRLWTRAARALAAAGRPSLRFDVRDVGDSDGASDPPDDLEAMYSGDSVEDAVRGCDQAREAGAAAVDVVGLCSGAFMAVQVAARRPVRRALLFNCLAFVWNEDTRASGLTSQISRSLLDGRRWRRLLTGRIDALALARAMATRSRLAAADAVGRLRGQASPDEVAALLRAVRARGTDLHLVSSQGDPSIDMLERHVPAPERPPLTILPGVDHTIRPVWAHDRVVELVLGDRVQGAHADPPPPGAFRAT